MGNDKNRKHAKVGKDVTRFQMMVPNLSKGVIKNLTDHKMHSRGFRKCLRSTSGVTMKSLGYGGGSNELCGRSGASKLSAQRTVL